jgi:predicted dehydrogenase
VLNVTPPGAHARVTADCLAAGCHVYSEKPLALDVSGGRALIDAARRARRLLLCAPAVMATTRFRWLRRFIDSGRIGRVTVATAQLGNLGPAAWQAYAGNVETYYQVGIGPAIDQGVYLLHALTGLLGPVRRVQSLQATTVPRRAVQCLTSDETTLQVSSPDVVLLQLDFGEGTLAQVMTSFAVPASRVPLMEIHAEHGSVVITEQPPLTDHGPASVFLSDGEHGLEGWLAPTYPRSAVPASNSLIAAGVTHFVDCLRGVETPLLTAEHALHVLDVIRTAEESAAVGRSLPVRTTLSASERGDDAPSLDRIRVPLGMSPL